MAYAFMQDVPIDVPTYRRIVDGLGSTPPEGLIFHLAVERPEGGLRYIDIWDSEEQFDRFAEERLHPVVHPLLMELIGAEPPEPPRTPLSVIHVWQGESAAQSLPGAS
ncbi:MAG: hypothetical protein JF887_06595 [Candidatus Dormibacteraeota bacterium]|uniref:ABM domain-containing protein n=1 Tax=Candidatus Amunia macphersoniae TaxID=3127014 RepID=A0A934KN73_9BACT|nr:hypothetical protein [Candidatus Dormibacteraeota bacterium]